MTSTLLSWSTVKRERTAEIPSFHHPSGNEHWPSLFDEARDMLDMSIFCYWAGDVRSLIKKAQLTDESTVNALFQMPSTIQELGNALEQTIEFFVIQNNNPSFELYCTALVELSRRYKELSAIIGTEDFFRLLYFEDEHEGKFGGPVYAITINHTSKRIAIGFRGSVTTKDFMCDWKTALRKIPNPLASEHKSAGEYIQIHHGFQEYLYDPILDTENGEGKIEKKPLIFHILEKVAKVFEDYPDYFLYATGHSLGGALATLFAMEAGASKDPRIKKPVTCITIASPRVGSLSFARTFQKLEKSRRLRCFRVVNDGDLIPLIPATANVNCLYVSCCQNRIYRDVGIRCHLFDNKKPSMTYAQHYDHPVQLFFTDFGVQMKGIIKTLIGLPFLCTCHTRYASSHSCMEYVKRIKFAESYLSKLHMNEVYLDKRKEQLVVRFAEAGAAALHVPTGKASN